MWTCHHRRTDILCEGLQLLKHKRVLQVTDTRDLDVSGLQSPCSIMYRSLCLLANERPTIVLKHVCGLISLQNV